MSEQKYTINQLEWRRKVNETYSMMPLSPIIYKLEDVGRDEYAYYRDDIYLGTAHSCNYAKDMCQYDWSQLLSKVLTIVEE